MGRLTDYTLRVYGAQPHPLAFVYARLYRRTMPKKPAPPLAAYLAFTGESQVAFAARAGLSPMTVNHYVRRRRIPKALNLAKLTTATGIAPERFTLRS